MQIIKNFIIKTTRYLEKWMSKVAGSRIPPSKQLKTLHIHYTLSISYHAVYAAEFRGICTQSHITKKEEKLLDP